MGLENIATNMDKIIQIIGGTFAERVPEGTTGDDIYQRTLEKGPNAGSIRWERRMNGYSGRIVGATLDDSPYGKNLNIRINDDNETAKIQITETSPFFKQFAKRIPNLIDGAWVTFGLFLNEKGKATLFMKQEGEKLPSFFTKDNMGDMPPAEEKVVRGEKKLDFDAQENFLYDLVVDYCNSFKADEEVPF